VPVFLPESSLDAGMMTWGCCLLQHQQQVATAVDRAKQVTMTELNAIIGVSTKLKSFTESLHINHYY
jgi:hypothetical protein